MLNTQFGLVASGDLYMDFYDDSGNLTGFQLVGNCKKFAPKVETETKENKLNGRDTLGQTADSYTRITGSTVSLVFNRYDPTLLAASFMGCAVDRAAATGPYTATITGIKDRWVEVGAVDLDTCTVKDATDTDTYIEGTDYEVNKRTGMVKVLTVDLDGATLHVSGNKLGQSGFKITGATRPMVNVALRLDGKNNADGSPVLVTIWRAQLRADGEFDFMGEDFPELTFSGTMTTPNGKSWPFEVV
ncbi:MAG: hypothetical protein LBD10_07480 [Desulfobulbus sp.]|jgi:hypothetical protein|uniref:phage tail tube protein n=1 Tax=Desulfobulbus sp. TaxID=895 RepID=UPI00284095E7|nr:hypothetical protein [Desulfobulbus sp.]MDR2550019.1 hypothetical protein [Desulfobulbus sp.]